MNESTVTDDLLSYLRGFKGVFFKHADRATIGLPDISATTERRTTWVEAKFIALKPKQKIEKSIAKAVLKNRVQYETMKRLAVYGRAIYVIFIYDGLHWKTRIASPFAPFENFGEEFEGKAFSAVLIRITQEEIH